MAEASRGERLESLSDLAEKAAARLGWDESSEKEYDAFKSGYRAALRDFGGPKAARFDTGASRGGAE